MIAVEYSKETAYDASGVVPRPLLPVRLEANGRGFDTLGLVDSGADRSMFHISWAIALGFTPKNEDAVLTGGTAGDVPTWYFDIHVTVAGKRFPARAGFVHSGNLAPRGLLGREDFFHAFAVGFDQRRLRTLYHPNA